MILLAILLETLLATRILGETNSEPKAAQGESDATSFLSVNTLCKLWENAYLYHAETFKLSDEYFNARYSEIANYVNRQDFDSTKYDFRTVIFNSYCGLDPAESTDYRMTRMCNDLYSDGLSAVNWFYFITTQGLSAPNTKKQVLGVVTVDTVALHFNLAHIEVTAYARIFASNLRALFDLSPENINNLAQLGIIVYNSDFKDKYYGQDTRFLSSQLENVNLENLIDSQDVETETKKFRIALIFKITSDDNFVYTVINAKKNNGWTQEQIDLFDLIIENRFRRGKSWWKSFLFMHYN
eukprot:NODE_128_length_18581_cov_0.247538.p6 type:complete len:297 gc:universal NODE_128_length_18581_cov_0.247538:1830-2720(+)